MGSAFSQNIINSITRAVSKVSTDIIQKTALSEDSSQIISVTNIDGDVHIEGNTFKQVAFVNMQALMTAITTTDAQQTLVQELTQEAKSVISGLNLAQFSDAENIVNTLVEAEIQILTHISQECATGSRQTQQIVVDRVKQNVYIQNNVMEQMSNILQNCVQSIVANNQTLQDALNQVAQKASSASKGVSEWAIIAAVAILFGLPVIGGVVFGKEALKYIFPLILIIGIGLIILYFVKITQEMQLTGYSSGIINTPVCMFLPRDPIPDTSLKTQQAAADICFNNTECQAFDWIAGEVQPDGSLKPYPAPKTLFYTNVSKSCAQSIKPDGINVLYTPQMFQNTAPPPTNLTNINEGDVYMNQTTAEWYQLSNKIWKFRGVLASHPFSIATWGNDPPTTTFGANQVPVFINSKLLSSGSPLRGGEPFGVKKRFSSQELSKSVYKFVTDTDGGVMDPARSSRKTRDVRADTFSARFMSSPINGDVYIYFNPRNPSIFEQYRYISEPSAQWKLEQTLAGPGLVPKATALPYTNTSGFKTITKEKLYLYGGVLFLVVGSIGTFFTLQQTKKQTQTQ